MMKVVNLDPAKCTQCLLCVQVCPVRAIKLGVNQETPVIQHDRCIGCGSCVGTCADDAISYHRSIEAVKSLLNGSNEVAAIVDPSIAAEFPDITDYRKFAGMIRLLGFARVSEIAFAVELVAARFASLVDAFKGRYYLTSNCPSLVLYIEKYYPHLVENLVPLASPMTAMASVMHMHYGDQIKVVAIVPCISQKIEAARSVGKMKVDEVITFTELREMFAEQKISETSLEYSDFDPPHGRIGAIYPIDNGFVQAAGLSEEIFEGKVFTASGKDSFINAVREFDTHPEELKHHFNIFYDKGCMMGPGMTYSNNLHLRHVMVADYAGLRSAAIDKREWQQHFAKYSSLDFSRNYHPDDQRLPMPTEEQISEILQATGKQQVDQQHSCEMCGFTSCREFAIAVAQGLSRMDSCTSYSVRTKQEYIRNLRKSNDALLLVQKQLKDSENEARGIAVRAQETLDTLGVLIKKIPAGIVIVDENLRVVESNPAFISMLGEDVALINEVIPGLKNADLKTLLPFGFYNLFKFVLANAQDIIGKDVSLESKLLNVSIYSIVRNKIAGAVIRDMYLPEVQKEELEKRLTDVIDQNLRMVQEIGFLLGEGASNTERMLNTIIETHKGGPKKTE